MNYAVNMTNVTKKFGPVIANDSVDFYCDWGEIHGLVGENGAGKTTLMRMLYGLYQPSSGEIYIDGKPMKFDSPKDAIAKGIGMVHQHFSLVPNMTVTENIIIGNPPNKHGVIDFNNSYKMVKEISEKYGLTIDPKSYVKDLPVGLQQRVEILKALYLGADILIMDEPTAVLTPQEIDGLIETLTLLKKNGKSIILITHKLKEIMAATDRITVLRNGKITARLETSKTDEKEIASKMVGRDVLFDVGKKKNEPGEVILELNNVSCKDKLGLDALKNVSLNVRRGEVVGVAGVQGNGQTELGEVISGLIPVSSGSVKLNGEKLEGKNLPYKCRKLGLGHIHDDRMSVGSALDASIRDNFISTIYNGKSLGKGINIDYDRADHITKDEVKKYSVKIGKISDDISSLSGGNMQKLIVARELFVEPSLLVASQPTRGVDIGAAEFIYEKIIEERDKGCGVLLISNELSEIFTLSDRILVIYNGEIVGELGIDEADERKVGLLMAGLTEDNETEVM